jgi:hypothetical protein
MIVLWLGVFSIRGLQSNSVPKKPQDVSQNVDKVNVALIIRIVRLLVSKLLRVLVTATNGFGEGVPD